MKYSEHYKHYSEASSQECQRRERVGLLNETLESLADVPYNLRSLGFPEWSTIIDKLAEDLEKEIELWDGEI